jgi:hypothetical protein
LQAAGLQVGGDAFLDDGFNAAGYGPYGTVRLNSADIGGRLSLRRATLTGTNGPAMSAVGLVVRQSALLDDDFCASGDCHPATLQLSGCAIKGSLAIDVTRVTSAAASCRLVVDGLSYQSLSAPEWGVWLDLLAKATPDYAAQPYRQLAAFVAARGHDSETRTVLMGQRDDQLRRAKLSTSSRLWGRFTHLTLGYGYQPWRSLIGLLLTTLLTAVLLASPVGAHGLEVKDKPAQACTVSDRVVLGVDIVLPLVTTSVAGTCLPNSSAYGRVVSFAGVIAQILGWAFATLFVAGFTGAVRKT